MLLIGGDGWGGSTIADVKDCWTWLPIRDRNDELELLLTILFSVVVAWRNWTAHDLIDLNKLQLIWTILKEKRKRNTFERQVDDTDY